MINNEQKSEINKALNFWELSEKIRKIAVDSRYNQGYSVFDFYKKDYSLKEINDFYIENKKLLFKKWSKFNQELHDNWSKTKYEKLVNMVICKMLLKWDKLDDILNKLWLIIKQIEYNNLNNEGLNDIAVVDNLKKQLSFDYEKISKEFADKWFKNFVYKHIIPNAILNDEKGHFYTSSELQYIANLKYNLSDIKALESEYNNLINIDYSELTVSEIRKNIKRSTELIIILFFLADTNLRPDYIKPFIDTYDTILQIENPSPAWLYLYSYSSILYSMAYWKDEYGINYNWIMSPFCFIHNIKPLLELLK